MVGIEIDDVLVLKLFNAQFKHGESFPPLTSMLINIVPTCYT
jgi:hypothetical protein